MGVELTSIDNMYEDDGLANLYGCLNGLLLGQDKGQKIRIVAILPEFNEIEGRIERMNVLSYDVAKEADELERPDYAPGALDVLAASFAFMATLVAGLRDRAHQAAVAQLEASPVAVAIPKEPTT